jgi:hypothetical protein
MKDQLNTRRLGPDDFSKLPHLLEKVWGTNTTREYWEWKYKMAPFETKGFVVENQDDFIISFNGFWLRPAYFAGQKIFPAMSMDTMTHPEYRNRSIFENILKRFIMILNDRNIVWGFTNPVSHKMFGKALNHFLKLDLKMDVYVNPLNPGAILPLPKIVSAFFGFLFRNFQKIRLFFVKNRNIVIEPTNDIGIEFDQLWNEIKNEYCFIQNRGKEFVKWRYTLNPHRQYKIWKATENGKVIGFLVTSTKTEKDRRKGYLVDWLVPRKRPDIFKLLVRAALIWFISQKIDLVETWLLDHEKIWKRILKSYFFLSKIREETLLFFAHDEIVPSEKYTKENLFLTIGDSDYLGPLPTD